jgi:hypothetical protein
MATAAIIILIIAMFGASYLLITERYREKANSSSDKR